MILHGRLIPIVRNPGSMSEHPGFALETPQGERVVVEKRNDPPFTSESLIPFAHHEVRVSGVLYRGRFFADEIVQLD